MTRHAAAAAAVTVTAGQVLAYTTRPITYVASVQLQTKSATPQQSAGMSPAARVSISAETFCQGKAHKKIVPRRYRAGRGGEIRCARFGLATSVRPQTQKREQLRKSDKRKWCDNNKSAPHSNSPRCFSRCLHPACWVVDHLLPLHLTYMYTENQAHRHFFLRLLMRLPSTLNPYRQFQ